MEDVTSCEDHNMKGILRNSAQESPPGERSDSDLESLLDPDADPKFHPGIYVKFDAATARMTSGQPVRTAKFLYVSITPWKQSRRVRSMVS
ncbi:hypothetical protein ElyMa_002824700 [Elysia marginata]|uniref:Uncharacterized protein n=1 Tax=Elysia marginata TaxID=1093978 RepID=A0AAV4HWE6_9GAST|nr:hypothetical protein ElyMa_002824700 [Elysia marginata]